jgi:peptidoglycan LD-endopeptidase CwlK
MLPGVRMEVATMKPRIADMDQELQVKFAAFSARMAEAGIPFALNCVLRTVEEQAAFYAQGRLPLHEVNKLRADAGMYLLKSEKENYIVTKTKISRHFPDQNRKARAFDITILKDGGKPHWDLKWDGNQDGISDYLEAAHIGKGVGLDPGGLWKSWQDYPHYELPLKV